MQFSQSTGLLDHAAFLTNALLLRLNKTGTRQYTQAVWSTFAEIHSRYSPRSIDALFWGYWNFRLEFVMPYISQHTRDVPNIYPMIAISSLLL